MEMNHDSIRKEGTHENNKSDDPRGNPGDIRAQAAESIPEAHPETPPPLNGWADRWKSIAHIHRAGRDYYRAKSNRLESEIATLKGLLSIFPPNTGKYPGDINILADTAASIAAARARCISVCNDRRGIE